LYYEGDIRKSGGGVGGVRGTRSGREKLEESAGIGGRGR